MRPEVKRYFAKQAWIDGAWAVDVVLSVDDLGAWCDVQRNSPPEVWRSATQLNGAVLPGLVNAHSHAFQRAIVGLTEDRAIDTAAGADDDFWSWRSRMYSAANRVTPADRKSVV